MDATLTTGHGDLRVREPDEGARYEAERELARGGAGKILVAMDRRLGRTVALKVPIDERSAGRVEHEAQIVAGLAHPAIIPVHDVGRLGDGTPFYAMKLVEGGSLREVLRGKATLAERLPLVNAVLHVIDAVAHAHRRGVMHLDLKPGNVLVGPFGETVVIDWGLARRIGEDTEAIEGTPAYMPPEQARGEKLDERADVYALGAMLYQVLSGRVPYRDASDVLEEVLAGPPAPLGALEPDVPADLQTIVARAMARDADDRYPSAVELGEDVRRFLDGRLVAAHRYSAAERVARWARRHRALIAMGGVAVAALMALGAASAWRIVEERDRARAERDRARAQHDAAEELVDFMLGDLRTRLAAIQKLEVLDGVGAEVERYYGKVRPADDAAVRRQARAMVSIGSVAHQRGDLDTAERAFTRARDLRQGLRGGAEVTFELASAWSALADVAGKRGDVDEQRRRYGEAGRLIERAIASDPAHADVNKWRVARASVHRKTGATYKNSREPEAAAAEYQAARVLLERVVADQPSHEVAARDLASTLTSFGDIARDRGKFAEGLAHYRDSLARHQQLIALAPDNREHQRGAGLAWMGVGDMLYATDQLDNARRAYDEAVTIHRALVAHDPTRVQWLRDLSQAIGRSGGVAREQSRHADAITIYRESLALAEQISALSPDDVDDRRNIAIAWWYLATVHIAAGDIPAAIAANAKALALTEELARADPANVEWKLDIVEYHTLAAQLGHDKAASLATARAILADVPDGPRKQEVAAALDAVSPP